MTNSAGKNRHASLLGSATERSWNALTQDSVAWVDVLRLTVGSALALILAYSLNVSGGFVTVLGVLFIPFMPHTPVLGLLRMVAGVVACGAGWVISYQLVDQPWLLVPLLAFNCFIFFYLLARGLPLMTMLILGLFPLAVGWMLMTGRTGSDVVVLILELECGLFAAELVAFVWPKTAERQLRTRIGQELIAVRDDYRAMMGESQQPGRLGKVEWKPSRSLGFNRVSDLMKSERGKADLELSRLLSIVNHTRYLLAWPTIFSSFVPSGKFDRWMIDLRSIRNQVHQAVYRILPDLSSAVMHRRPAGDIEDLKVALDELNQKTADWIEKYRGEESIETLSLPLLRCNLGGSFLEHTQGIHDLTHGAEPPDPIKTHEFAPSIFDRINRIFDERALLFAFRATLCPLVALMFGMTYPDWSGALILVLLSGFLAPLTMGGIAMMFVDRIFGLVLAAFLALFFYLLIMPDLVDLGVYLLFLSLFALPFLVLTVNPATTGIGLSGSMAIYFMLTSPNNPSVDLSPIQARLLSVGGATCISYLVFSFVFPVRSINTVGTRLAEVFTQMAATLDCYQPRLDWQKNSDSTPGPDQIARHQEENEQKIWSELHTLVARIMTFDQMVSDLQWELSHNKEYDKLRIRMLQAVNGIAPVLANLMFCKVHYEHSTDHEQMVARRDAREAMFRLLLGLAHYTDSDTSDKALVDDLLVDAEDANRRLKRQIESTDFRERLAVDHPAHGQVRSVLVEYAYNATLIRHLRKTRQLLVLRRHLNLNQRGIAVTADYAGG